ncbi:MAG: transglutaminase-like domain-containing protein [Desulfobacterales bacterium]
MSFTIMADRRKPKKIAWIGAVLLSLGVAGAFIATRGRPDAPDLSFTAPPVQKSISYRFTLQNTSNRSLPSAEFVTYAPVGETAFQQCLRLESDHPFQERTDAAGNRIVQFTFDRFPPFASKIITLKADLQLTETPRPEAPRDFAPYLTPEKYIESDHPEIIRTARALTGETPLKTAENMCRWVAGSLRHEGYDRRERGALYALQHREGDCTESAYLFVALCRAAGIPARAVGGYICLQSGTLKPGGYHNWAHFHDGTSWQTADPGNGVFRAQAADYVVMRVMGASGEAADPGFQRFRLKGAGLKARMHS